MAATRTLQSIADAVGGTLLSGAPDATIGHLASLEDAREGDLAFFENAKYRKAALASKATAMLVREKLEGWPGAQIGTPMPAFAFQALVNEFYPPAKPPQGVHPTAVVLPGATVDPSASIGPHVTVEAGATIGARAWLMSGCYVGRDCVVGEDSILYPNVVLLERSRLGKRCLIHSGSVIGDDGFGYQRDETGHRKIRHVGHVEVGDDVEMGANVAIDRGTYGRTVIGAGTKIDNLVHIAHNVQVGERTLLIAQVGIAGSARVGNDSIIAGQAGIADHAVVGDATIVVAQSAVPRRAKSGEAYAGSPAIPARRWMAASAAFGFLPSLMDRVRAIEKKLGIKTAPAEKDDEG